MNNGKFYPINQPYGYCLLPLDPQNRDETSSQVYGDGIHFTNCVQKLIQSPEVIGVQNTTKVNSMDQYFFNQTKRPFGTENTSYFDSAARADIQIPQVTESKANSYITLAAQSLHITPDTQLKLFFSDANVDHLRNTVVNKVRETTAQSGVAGDNKGVTIKKPNMDDMFYYMVNIYKNYKVYNGSICFANLKNNTDYKKELLKLNTSVLQEYVSKMISEINMYIYYYKDASQLPQQLSLPTLTSMKGSKTLEYNTGFTPGNSIGIASFNEVGNIY